jgi:hypothetical protein
MLSDENSAANEPTSVAYSAITSNGAACIEGLQLPEGMQSAQATSRGIRSRRRSAVLTDRGRTTPASIKVRGEMNLDARLVLPRAAARIRIRD